MPAPVYLLRHGQSAWNVLRLTQGQTAHPPLTALGREQARRAARLVAADLAGRRPARIVSSDLVRAVETARIVGETLGAEVVLDPRLREQHLGDLQGRGYDETWAAAAEHDWSDPTLPVAGGESLMDVHDRLADVLAELAGTPAPTVLVSHGDAIRTALAHVAGLAPHEAPWVEVDNGAVIRLDAAPTAVAATPPAPTPLAPTWRAPTWL